MRSWTLWEGAKADLISTCLKAKVTMPRIEHLGLWSLNWLQSKGNSEQTILWTNLTFSYSFIHSIHFYRVLLKLGTVWSTSHTLLSYTKNNSKRYIPLLSQFYRWISWVSEKLSNLLRLHSMWLSSGFNLGLSDSRVPLFPLHLSPTVRNSKLNMG